MKKIILLFFALAASTASVFRGDRHIAFERNDAVYKANLDGTNEKKIVDGIFPARRGRALIFLGRFNSEALSL